LCSTEGGGVYYYVSAFLRQKKLSHTKKTLSQHQKVVGNSPKGKRCKRHQKIFLRTMVKNMQMTLLCIVNKVGKINLNNGLLTQIYVFRMVVTPPAKRQRVSELSQALTQVTQVNTVTRTYTVVDLTVDPPQEEVVSVVDEVTPRIWNYYYLRKNHDSRYPDKYLRAKRGLSMTTANPRRWFYSCSKPRWE
jgi:hypothetical protein